PAWSEPSPDAPRHDAGALAGGILILWAMAFEANYSSGDDFEIEFLEHRFAFNVLDFQERVTAAAVKLGLVEGNELDDDETADLVELVHRGFIEEARSPLGRYLIRHWERVSLPGQLLRGVLTGAALLAALRLFEPERRAQALVVVAAATCGEVTGSILWGVYSYRLHNLPLFVPPGHGIVYLTGFALSTTQF